MGQAPIVLAFTAGMVATVNPCGFAMLPAYLSWFIGVDQDPGPSSARLGRALAVSALVTISFVVVFGIAGIAITAGALAIIDVIPWLAMVIGIAITVAGLAMLGGWKPIVSLPHPSLGVGGHGALAVVLFGFSYAVASLSCTLPVFLAVVAGTLTTADLTSGAVTFVVYGLGMGLVLVAAAVAVAFAHDSMVRRLRRAARLVDRAAAALLVSAGVYITGYWAFTLAVPAGTTDRPRWARALDGPIGAVDRLSAWSVNILQQWVTPAAVIMALAVGAAVWKATMGKAVKRPAHGADEPEPERSRLS